MLNSILTEAFTLSSCNANLSQYKMETNAVTWTENINQSFINFFWCVNNSMKYEGYSKDSWGLTASYSIKFYSAYSPDETYDLDVISPIADFSSSQNTPEHSLAALKYRDYDINSKFWKPYGLYDAYCKTDNRYKQKYRTIDQVPISMMNENHGTEFLWDLFLDEDEVSEG